VKLVAGLGNPGREYEDTRHNVGFRVVEAWALRTGASWRFRGDRAEAMAGGILLLKPLTYMNLSGPAVKEALGFRDATASDCLVVCDDMALTPGAIRLRPAGSSGGHHGLDSIIAALGTDAFPRLRIGIGGPPPGIPGADFVLGRFKPGESPPVEAAVDAAEAWARLGVERAMAAHNTPRQRD